MNKKLLCFIVALSCLFVPVLTACGGGKVDVPERVAPLTFTLYGIKGEGTTDEAIQAVQDRLNVYTEGNLNTHVILRLFTEDEYYLTLDRDLFAAQKYKDDIDNGITSATTEKPETTGEAGKDDNGDKDTDKSKYPAEKGTQVDIFMVRGGEKFEQYRNGGYTAAVTLTEKSSLIKQYISDRYLALTNPDSLGTLGTKLPNGIVNNNVYGEYTYLLVDKDVAGNYGYAEKNLDTLPELALFLNDAAKDYSDYITLYNEPVIDLETFGDTLLGTVVDNNSTAFSKYAPTSLLDNDKYVQYKKYLTSFKDNGYITEGDYHSLPEEKFAAAFVKGNAALPEQYKEDYIVVPYAKPVMNDFGTVFCVSNFVAAIDQSRALEIVNLLQTNAEYRNIFQYGVENVHYRVDEYTGIIDIISDEYNMNPADTGNLFLLWENSSMDEATKALCKNNWELAKLQARETVFSPYVLFNPTTRSLDFDSFKAESDKVALALEGYKASSGKTFEEYAAELNEAFKATDAYKNYAGVPTVVVPPVTDTTDGETETPSETDGSETTEPEATEADTTEAESTEAETTTEPETEAPAGDGSVSYSKTIAGQYDSWCEVRGIV